MKRAMGLVLFLLIIGMTVFACAEEAETITSGDYRYTLNEDGCAVISKYSGWDKELTIPSELDGHPVKGIGDEVFFDCSNLISVTIPDSVTDLGANPWKYCDNLNTISVSPGHPALAVIDGALYSKADKKLVWVSMSTEGTFEIPQGIRIIGDMAFCCCESLTSVTIPDSVTTIGDWAFSSCKSLTSVTIPVSVTAIGECVFAVCESLTSVTIPDSVTSIGNKAFYYCVSLTSVTIPDSVTAIGDHAFSGCFSLTSVTIPDSVTSIGDDVFSRCDSLTAGPIPGSVTAIGDGAFYFCYSLTSVTIPDSVTVIGNSAFSFCGSLSMIIVTKGSFAEQYCIDNNLPYQYTNYLDWLND